MRLLSQRRGLVVLEVHSVRVLLLVKIQFLRGIALRINFRLGDLSLSAPGLLWGDVALLDRETVISIRSELGIHGHSLLLIGSQFLRENSTEFYVNSTLGISQMIKQYWLL